MARTTYETSRTATLALRAACAPIFLPLFDHCVSLAAHSHASGYPQRAGQELAKARKVAAYTTQPRVTPMATTIPSGATVKVRAHQSEGPCPESDE